MKRERSPEHEAKCRRCAQCCYEKLILDGRVFTTRTPCPHLDVETHRCDVYERRFEVNPRCLDVPGAIEFGVFPADCPYVQDLADYVPPVEGQLDDEIVRMIETGVLRTCEDVIAEMRRRSS